MTSHPQTQGGDRKNQCESKSRFARLKCSAVPGCLEAIVTRSLNVDHLRVRPRPPEARPDSLRPLNQRAVVALSFMARCPDCGSSSAAVIGNSRTVIATGNEQRCVRAAHMLRFHSNGCDRDDNRQNLSRRTAQSERCTAAENVFRLSDLAPCGSTRRSGRRESPKWRRQRSPMPAIRPPRPVSSLSSISYPASRNSIPSPSSRSTSIPSPTAARPSTPGADHQTEPKE